MQLRKSEGCSDDVQADLQNVAKIQSNYEAFAALKRDGTVVTWGNADHGGDSRRVQRNLRGDGDGRGWNQSETGWFWEVDWEWWTFVSINMPLVFQNDTNFFSAIFFQWSWKADMFHVAKEQRSSLPIFTMRCPWDSIDFLCFCSDSFQWFCRHLGYLSLWWKLSRSGTTTTGGLDGGSFGIQRKLVLIFLGEYILQVGFVFIPPYKLIFKAISRGCFK